MGGEQQPGGRSANILLVDDNPANLLSLRALLEGAGDALIEAHCGEEALRLAAAEDFAVILLDAQMQGIDGFETAQQMRRYERSKATPIIFLTAFDSSREQISRAYSLGAVDYLVKPLMPDVIRAKVDVFVELFRRAERLRQLERSAFENQLAAANRRREQTALAAARIFAEFTSETDAVGRILEAVCENLGWDAGACWELDEAGAALRCAEFWQPPPARNSQFEAASRARTFAAGIGLPGRVWADGKTVWVRDLHADDNFPRLDVAQREEIRGALAFPVTSGGELLGVMEFFSRETREPDEETLRALADIGVQFGQFIQRRRAEAALAQSARRMEAILGAALDCVITIDQRSTVVEWNRAAETTFGYSRQQAIGQDMAELIIPRRLRAAHHAGLTRLLATGQEVLLGKRVEMVALRADGEEFPAELTIVRLPSSDRPLFTGFLRDITERKRAEKQLAEQREWLQVTLASIGDAVIATDRDGRVTFLNPVAEELTGWKEHDATGRPLDAVFHIINEITRDTVENPALRALRHGAIVGLANHTLLIARDGAERPIDDSAAPIRDARGETIGAVLIFRDVSQRRRADDELRASEHRFQSFMRRSPATAYIKDAEGKYLFVNRIMEEQFERPLDQWIGKTDLELFPAEDAERYRQNDRSVLKTGAGAQFIESAVHAGETRHYQSFKFPLEDRQGASLLAGMSLDITELLRSEQALRESEGRFRQLADSMPQIVYVMAPGGKVEYLNQGWRDYTGVATADDLSIVVHADDLVSIVREYHRAEIDAAPFEYEFRLRRADGQYRWFLTRAVPLCDRDGRVVKWFGTSTDIDDTKRAEQIAKFLADASATLAELTDPDSTLQKVAALAVPHFADWCTVDLLESGGSLRRLAAAHVDPAKMELARELHRRFPPDPEAARGVWNIVRTGQTELVSEITDELIESSTSDPELLRIIRELGLKSYIGVPLAAHGKTLGAITFIAAESGRRYREADLEVAADLARRAAIALDNAYLYSALREEDRRKDEFLATLAHELRNPLAPIRNGLQVMKIGGHDRDLAEQARAMMERQVTHLVRLVDDLLDVSRVSRGKIELRKTRMNVAAAVDSAVETCAHLIEAREHKLVVALPDEPLHVDADKTRLAQVLCNLLQNAAKYTDRGGKIWLTVERQGADAVFRVKDTGVGIPAPMLRKIFNLFTQVDRSLERSQGGLGIGLTLVKRLIELHGGRVEAHSAGEGRGSEFIVRLSGAPSVVDPPPEPRSNAPVAAPGSRLRVLVVDDNIDAAESLATMLRMMGNDARTAHDGAEAVERAEEFRPQLVLLDIGMPKVNGYDCCRRIREQPWAADLPIVALTGWGQEADKQRSREAGFNRHLVKPIEPAELEKLIALELPGKGRLPIAR